MIPIRLPRTGKSSCNIRTPRGHSGVPRRPGSLECWNEFIFLEKDIQI